MVKKVARLGSDSGLAERGPLSDKTQFVGQRYSSLLSGGNKNPRRKIDFHGTLACYLHYTLKHDVFVVDCDYQSSDMRAVEQTPVRCLRAAESHLFRR